MEPSFYAIIPADVRYDERLKPNAKLLYGEITALANREGFCWAANDYFADLYKVSTETVSRWVSQLNKCGYIEVEMIKNDGNQRRITIDKKVKTSCQKKQDPLTKKARPLDKKVNSYIRINNTINNTENKRALEFLKENAPITYEEFEMRFKSKVQDFDKFCELFNCKVDEEGLEFTTKILNARLTRFAINYSEKESPKGAKGNYQNTDAVQQAYRNNVF